MNNIFLLKVNVNRVPLCRWMWIKYDKRHSVIQGIHDKSSTVLHTSYISLKNRSHLIYYLAAYSEKCFPGCLCRRVCRSPPGQNSITKQENLSVSKCVYKVGRNGWSRSCKISLSVWALFNFFLLARMPCPLPSLQSSTEFHLILRGKHCQCHHNQDAWVV